MQISEGGSFWSDILFLFYYTYCRLCWYVRYRSVKYCLRLLCSLYGNKITL